MDQGLKERLVGAAVLVAIAVWLIPWVLDGPEGGVETPANALQLPSAEEPMPMRTQTLKLGDALEPSAGPATAPSATPPALQAAARPEPAKSTAESRDDAGIDARGGAVAELKVEAEPTLVAANRVAESPKSAAASTALPKPEGAWTVQLGSFEDEANARRLAQRAGSFGYKADVSSYKSGARTLYRVRVGPQATKPAADAAASALRAHGVEARVVAAH
jgi:DedD protein